MQYSYPGQLNSMWILGSILPTQLDCLKAMHVILLTPCQVSAYDIVLLAHGYVYITDLQPSVLFYRWLWSPMSTSFSPYIQLDILIFNQYFIFAYIPHVSYFPYQTIYMCHTRMLYSKKNTESIRFIHQFRCALCKILVSSHELCWVQGYILKKKRCMRTHIWKLFVQQHS